MAHPDADITELTKLRPRGTSSNVHSYVKEKTYALPDDVVYLEREILPNDSLQSFSLLYGCTVNDIKRANNMITEQDFYALKRLKIPVKRHGLMTDADEERKRRAQVTTSLTSSLPNTTVNGDGTTTATSNHNNDVYHRPSPDVDAASSVDDSAESLLGSPGRDHVIERNDASRFLKTMDKEIRKTVRSGSPAFQAAADHRNEVLEEVVSSLGSVGYRPLAPPRADDCDGSDWGVKWWALLLCFVVVFLLLIFIVVYEYHTRKRAEALAIINSTRKTT